MAKISLRAARISAGYSAEKAAKQVGVSRFTLLKYEKGDTVPRWDVFETLCKLYGVSVTDIFLPKE